MSHVVVFVCKNIGISGTTEVFCRSRTCKAYTRHGYMEYVEWEARMGIAIMGGTNQTDHERALADNNPFHPEFHDNYACGKGPTKEQSLAALEKDVKSMTDSLWA